MSARTALPRVFWVARREYLERLRSKAFLIATVLGPLLMAAFVIGPALLATRHQGKPLAVAVVDATGALRPAVEDSIRRREGKGTPRFRLAPAPADAGADPLAAARRAVLAGELDGFLYLPPDALERWAAEYHGKYVANRVDIDLLDTVLEEALLARRLASYGVPTEDARRLTRPVDLKTVRLSDQGAREGGRDAVVFALVLLMMQYTALAMWGQAIMNGVIEEKANRVVEVLVSSVPSSTLFAGKLAGVGAAGLTQFAVWALSLALLGLYAQGAGSLLEVSLLTVAALVGFFLLGYFLYGALYAAVGAAVNTQQEAQALAFPVLSPMVAAVVFFPVVLGRPDGGLAVALSLVPFFTPLLMFLRISVLPPPAWQVALSVGLTLATIAGLTWGAARIYRVGILMYGKRPTLPEMLRWVRLS